MESAEKVRENRVRRMARRQALELVKSRRRDPQSADYGTYQLINPKTKIIAFQHVGWRVDGKWGGVGLDEVEQWLTTAKSPDRIDTLNDDQLEELHLARVSAWIGDDRPSGIIYHQGRVAGPPYVGFIYDLEQPQIDTINMMLKDGASKEEIWLQVQEWVDDFLSDRDAISFEASAVQYLASETDLERKASGEWESPTGRFAIFALDDQRRLDKAWAELRDNEWSQIEHIEREELINRMRGYWLVTGVADQPLEATKYETLTELEEAFDDLETEYTKWLKKGKP
jgi:hypothetical protein